MSTDLQALVAAASAFSATLQDFVSGQNGSSTPVSTGSGGSDGTPSVPAAYVPPSIGATQVIQPSQQLTINVAATDPPTQFSWQQVPWAFSYINGFRVGVDRLDLSALIPGYTGTDPVKDGFVLVSPTADSKGTQVLIDADGPGGNWGVTVVVLNGLLAWNVGGEVLFNGVLPPAPPPLDLTKLTLVPGSSDEFTGTAVDWTKWRSRWNYVAADASGCNLPSNGEQQWYVNHESTALSSLTPWVVANGQLTLVGDKLPDALKPLCGYATDANHPLGSYGYYSGMLQNSPVCSQTYGYFEVSVTMPKGQGLWPAFWLLPTDGSWPPEIDIFEQLGNDPSLFYFTKHYVQASDGSGQSEGLAVHVDTTGTHPIGLWWDANYLIVYVDGVEQGRVTNTNLTKPMYVVINLAVGGNWGGNPDATTVFPAKLVFDYVRVYTINP